MPISPLAGKPAPKTMLVDLARLEREYYERKPDVDDPNQLVSFGTSGHRGSPLRGSFTEAHILAITQAICDYRRGQGIDGPLYMGKDTHALSGPAQRTALEVLAANGVETIIQHDDGVTPTPVISRAILVYNRGRKQHLADGIVVTPSHNPPEDGGFKYNPPNGGPADIDVTKWVQRSGQRRCCAAATPASSACPSRRPSRRRPRTRKTSSCRMSRICGTSSTWTHPRGGPQAGRGPARRRRECLTGSRSTPSTSLDIAVVNPVDRPDVLVHDGRSRRQDPHGPFEPVRDGAAGRPEGPVPRRLRQRSGLGPARHRHAVCGADEPQPLSRRGDPLLAHASSALGRRTRQSARRWSAAA